MTLAQTLQVFEALDSARVNGNTVRDLVRGFDGVEVAVNTVKGKKGQTDFVQVTIPGTNGKRVGGVAPTLGIVGRLGGVGARPSRIGLVSDGDGAVAAVAAALKIATMKRNGDALAGDVIISTHICPDAPTRPHLPVDFMGSPVDAATVNAHELRAEMDAVLSIDTTKGNRVLNHKGYAITPTVRQGWILRVADDLLRIMEMTSGRAPITFPITMQDITPYGNDVYHLNSILQPAVGTPAPVVGVAICTESVVPGCGTGASHEVDIAAAVRFVVEVAKEFGRGTCRFFDPDEATRLVQLYGPMTHLQKRLKGQEAI
jgi:hypothetical protein